MAVAYPLGLSIPTVSGYSNTDGDRVRKDDLNQGLYDTALLSDYAGAEYSVKWLFSQVEYQVFEGFYFHELDLGAKAFDMSIKVGAGLHEHTFYFDGEYNASLLGKKWQVTAKLIALEKIYDVESDYDNAKFELVNIPDGSMFLQAYEDVDVGSTAPVYTNGNDTKGYQTVQHPAPIAGDVLSRSGQGYTAGKRYLEIEIITLSSDAETGIFGTPGSVPNRFLIRDGGFLIVDTVGSFNSESDVLSVGDIIGLVCDFDNGVYEYYRNGTLVISIDRGAGNFNQTMFAANSTDGSTGGDFKTYHRLYEGVMEYFPGGDTLPWIETS